MVLEILESVALKSMSNEALNEAVGVALDNDTVCNLSEALNTILLESEDTAKAEPGMKENVIEWFNKIFNWLKSVYASLVSKFMGTFGIYDNYITKNTKAYEEKIKTMDDINNDADKVRKMDLRLKYIQKNRLITKSPSVKEFLEDAESSIKKGMDPTDASVVAFKKLFLKREDIDGDILGVYFNSVVNDQLIEPQTLKIVPRMYEMNKAHAKAIKSDKIGLSKFKTEGMALIKSKTESTDIAQAKFIVNSYARFLNAYISFLIRATIANAKSTYHIYKTVLGGEAK